MRSNTPTDAQNNRRNGDNPACPVGESQCDIINQLVTLRSENSELSELVRTDTLTGIYNYRYFIKSLEKEMERTHRSDIATGLIMLDLDYFKKVNDTWGHEIGNDALVQTAELIKHAVRRLDIACRYGGEEFAVILPSTDLLICIQVAKRLCRLISSTPLAVSKGEIQITASLGVDIFTIHQSDTPEEFVKRADKLLYTAKLNGRNRVCHGTSDQTLPGQVTTEERDALLGLSDDSGKKPKK